MNQHKRIVRGLLAGSITGLVFAGLVMLGTRLIQSAMEGPGEAGAFGWIAFVIGPLSGAVVGAMSAGLSRAFGSLELNALCFLICIALGSGSVMLINSSSGSFTPMTIYGLAVVNGTLVLPVVRLASTRALRAGSRHNGRSES